ncbi:hypothetical protein CEXT_544021 [Caerostris extrusa]|uniref:Uncharacterized protein n=1 Tax=Caerostris extrusa TaxID=172846 RepID=A0AAV4SNU8_CAEEX|nr:hypothetical protein CEXT_544021 [Caerostris extrusa]
MTKVLKYFLNPSPLANQPIAPSPSTYLREMSQTWIPPHSICLLLTSVVRKSLLRFNDLVPEASQKVHLFVGLPNSELFQGKW